MIYAIYNASNRYAAYLLNETGAICYDNTSAMRLLKQLCLIHGSSFEGRKQAASFSLSIQQKIPILLNEKTNCIVFPTANIRSTFCMWMNATAIIEMKRYQNGTKIIFQDGKCLYIMRNIRTLKRSWKLSLRYLHMLEQSDDDSIIIRKSSLCI